MGLFKQISNYFSRIYEAITFKYDFEERFFDSPVLTDRDFEKMGRKFDKAAERWRESRLAKI